MNITLENAKVDKQHEQATKGRDRARKEEKYALETEGPGVTPQARMFAKECLKALAEHLEKQIDEEKNQSRNARYWFIQVISKLPSEVLALCVFQNALHCIGQEDFDNHELRETCIYIGEQIRQECRARRLLKSNKKLAKKIQKDTRTKSDIEARQKAASTIAERARFETEDWRPTQKTIAGTWAVKYLCDALPTMFCVVEDEVLHWRGHKEKHSFLRTTDLAKARLAELYSQFEERYTTYWSPVADPPPPWTGWNKGGAHHLNIVHTYYGQTEHAVRKAISDGSMKQALQALNTLQAVPWKINTRLLDVIRKGREQNIKASKNEVLYAENISVAERMAEHKQFYTPMHFDWRSRIYGVPSFNFQGEDYVRALFLFANGAPIGTQGEYWLKVHLANKGDFNKISKSTFDARVAWVDDNHTAITNAAKDPMSHRWWLEADKPFQFLAACMELVAAQDGGIDKYRSSLPVTFDGSCNGLQHLCAMTRAPESHLVNLTVAPLPEDMYQTVVDELRPHIERDLNSGNEETRQMARVCLDHIWCTDDPGRARKVFKRCVMTFAYSSEAYGMGNQLLDAIEKLIEKGELDQKVFIPFAAKRISRYLAQHVYPTIKTVVKWPAHAMTYLQKVVEVMAKENRPLRWDTPVGFPLINRYHKPETRQIRLHLSNFPVTTMRVADGHEAPIRVAKAKQGVVPNLVHALDASHLMLTVNAAAAEGITSITAVHDCFGCLASQSARFRQVIREQFVMMYKKHNPVNEIYQEALNDLRDQGNRFELSGEVLPPYPPKEAALNIDGVRNAKYAFA